jgi:hypothetical protein
MDAKSNQPIAKRKIRRGDIFYADLTQGYGSEQSGFPCTYHSKQYGRQAQRDGYCGGHNQPHKA